MRHIASLFAGLIIAPLAWLLIGAGQIGLNPSLYEAESGAPSKLIAALMLALAGVLLGLLAVTRMSPAGPVAAAFALIVGFAIFRTDLASFHIPASLESVKIPANAAIVAGDQSLFILVAVMLLMSAFVPARWRGKNSEQEENRDIDTAALSGTDSNSASTEYLKDVPEPQDSFSPPADAKSNVGYGYSNQTADSFSAPAGNGRSPYADDAYGPDDQSYQKEPSRHGDQPYTGSHGYR